MKKPTLKKPMNMRLPVWTAVSLILGILCAYLFIIGKILFAVLLATAFLASLLIITFTALGGKAPLKSRIILSAVFLLFFGIGIASFSIPTISYRNATLGSHIFTVSGKVTERYHTDNGVKLIVDDLFVRGVVKGEIDYKIALYVNDYEKDSTAFEVCDIDVGDIIKFNSHLYDKDIFYEGRFSSNEIERGIKYYASVDGAAVSIVGNKANLFEKVHLFIRDTLQSGLSNESFSVAYAMLLGHSGFMDADTLSSFRQAGVAHIFAVSGLHIGILAGFLTFILKKLRCPPLIRLIVTGITVFFYSGVCGFSASSLRAATMCIVLLLADALGYKYDGLSSVGIAATLILSFNGIELFNVGFQLSFAVVVGIIILSKSIANMIGRVLKFIPKKFALSLGTVLAAQLFAIPICLSAFKEVSLIAVLVNLLFLPIVNVVFIFLLVSTLLGGIFGQAAIFLFLAEYVIKAIIFLITLFDYRIFLIGGFTFGIFTAAYYGAGVVCAGLINFKRATNKIVALILSAVCLVGTVIYNVALPKYPTAYVIGSQGICATLITVDNENTLVVSDYSRAFSLNRLQRLKNNQGINKIDNLVVLDTRTAADPQNLLTRLLNVFDVDNLYYYGERDTALENAVEKSFKTVYIASFIDDEKLPLPFIAQFMLDGSLLDCSISGESIAIFVSYGSSAPNYQIGAKNYDLIIAEDYLDGIFAAYNPTTLISYRASHDYVDGESSGTYAYYFK